MMVKPILGSGTAVVALGASLSGVCVGFSYRDITRRCQLTSTPKTILYGELARSGSVGQTSSSPAANDALALLDEAKALRAQASALQLQLDREKEERIRKEQAKVDSLIDALLFHGVNDQGPTADDGEEEDESNKQQRSKQQLLHTEEQVAQLLISKRMNYDMVNQMFDRICEQSNRPQSIDSCSPLLSLLLDAACKVDCLEREDNPNKRWNHRVERDLRRKLFALGYGIRIEDVDEKNQIRSITGEKDYL
mmetsp:Transcript_25801/g.44048  ORF Transcript_25801/g.44048 Transcript_25801/m.44048 type:complete len:251 (-) Transcript_25801:125-877(-)